MGVRRRPYQNQPGAAPTVQKARYDALQIPFAFPMALTAMHLGNHENIITLKPRRLQILFRYPDGSIVLGGMHGACSRNRSAESGPLRLPFLLVPDTRASPFQWCLVWHWPCVALSVPENPILACIFVPWTLLSRAAPQAGVAHAHVHWNIGDHVGAQQPGQVGLVSNAVQVAAAEVP